jgi:ribonucleoside-diphosphate reductase alpha chain
MTINKEVEKVGVDYLEEISNFIFLSKYSRYNEKLGRRESWNEAVSRVENMHLKKYYFLSDKDKQEINQSFDLVRSKMVVPSMRSLQFGGKAIEAKNEKIYNCCVRHIDSIRSFAEVLYLLLCGCGVGLGISKYFLNRLSFLANEKDKTGSILTYTVTDSIEGWSDSVEVLLMSFFKNTPLTGRKVVFDYSKIRAEGESLKTSGGKAPGYKGLKQCHKKIKELLDHVIEYKHQSRLKTIDAYDIIMHCADATLSGGVRRSATSVIFDKNDEDMINAKAKFKVDKVFHFSHIGEETVGGFTNKIYEGKINFEGSRYEIQIKEYELEDLKNNLVSWNHLFPQRARSNNSVLLLRDKTTQEEFAKIIERTKQFGEPGFVWGNHPWQLFNPCFEIGFIPVTKDGICGVQFCNLTSQNGRKITSKEEFKKSVISATIIGTLQAGYTHFPYLSKVSEDLTKEESLLGVSITGMMDNPDILLNPEYQKEMAELSIEVNKIWSQKLQINQAARITCVKPEGTSSLILGTGSGIHAHHARKYFRRVQVNKLETIYKYFKKFNQHLSEPSVWSANKTDDVICFPIEVSPRAMIKKDLSAIKHLDYIKSTQENWVLSGVTKANQKPIEHNVSCTIIVKDNEWNDVIKYIFNNKNYFAAISFLPDGSDKVYQQAPMEAIVDEKDELNWKNIINNFHSVDYKQLKETDDNTAPSQEIVCAGDKCSIVTI